MLPSRLQLERLQLLLPLELAVLALRGRAGLIAYAIPVLCAKPPETRLGWKRV